MNFRSCVALRWLVYRPFRRIAFLVVCRRLKRWVPEPAKRARLAYAAWLKAQSTQTLRSIAYVDGTTFYLARDASEQSDKKRAALGPYVWRMASGKDGLFCENIGPSLYAHAQGKPVKIWGFLANGILKYEVLPQNKGVGQSMKAKKKRGGRGKKRSTGKQNSTKHMTGVRYAALVRNKFSLWAKAAWGRKLPTKVRIVQDHERCLWMDGPRRALREEGLEVVENYPKYSPDLNHIENCWHQLRDELAKNAPVAIEKRGAFLDRLRRTVQRMNKRGDFKETCSGQKKRADEVIELGGARTHY